MYTRHWNNISCLAIYFGIFSSYYFFIVWFVLFLYLGNSCWFDKAPSSMGWRDHQWDYMNSSPKTCFKLVIGSCVAYENSTNEAMYNASSRSILYLEISTNAAGHGLMGWRFLFARGFTFFVLCHGFLVWMSTRHNPSGLTESIHL